MRKPFTGLSMPVRMLYIWVEAVSGPELMRKIFGRRTGCLHPVCSSFQRKVYLTVNTLVKESEFSGLYEYVLPYYRAGLDGVIVQDMGVFAYLREHFPGMELHGSTQMTITGEYGAAF